MAESPKLETELLVISDKLEELHSSVLHTIEKFLYGGEEKPPQDLLDFLIGLDSKVMDTKTYLFRNTVAKKRAKNE